jgi:hypothetical protein
MRILILSLFCALAAGCGGPTADPDAELRQWVADAERHAENKDRSALMDMISSSYADARGNDFDELDKKFLGLFFRINKLSLVSTINEIVVSGGGAAEISLTVGMLGTENSLLGLEADAYRFDLELVRDSDEWLLLGARYGKLGGDMH